MHVRLCSVLPPRNGSVYLHNKENSLLYFINKIFIRRVFSGKVALTIVAFTLHGNLRGETINLNECQTC